MPAPSTTAQRVFDIAMGLIDEVNDAKLAVLAAQRMQGFDPANAIPAEEVYRQNGITKAALDSMDEVEFE